MWGFFLQQFIVFYEKFLGEYEVKREFLKKYIICILCEVGLMLKGVFVQIFYCLVFLNFFKLKFWYKILIEKKELSVM